MAGTEMMESVRKKIKNTRIYLCVEIWVRKC